MVAPSQISIILHPIGLACSIFVIISIVGLSLINKQLTNRMTVRLIAAIAVADLFSHSAELYSAVYRNTEFGSSLCQAVNGFRLFSRTLYSLTNIAISFHLYRSLVQMKKSTWKFEVITWIATLVAVVVLVLIYLALGALSGTQNKVGCNPGADNPTLNTVFYIITALVDLSAIISGIFITITGHRNLNKWINVYSATLTESGGNNEQIIKDRRKMAIRSFLYPLSTSITLPFEVIFHLINAFDSLKTALNVGIPMAVTIGCSGLLTALAFSIDPATHKSFKSAYYQLTNRYPDSKGSKDNLGMNKDDIHLGATQ